ncbi:MAG: response regulator transcription factor [Anaerolineae bacterium]
MTQTSRPSSTISVLVVDVQPLMQFAIRETLISHGRIQVVASVQTVDEAVARIRQHQPQVILYNVTESIHQLQSAIRMLLDTAQRARLPVKVCVFSSETDPRTIAAAREAGASGYLITHYDGMRLTEMIEIVAQGGVYENEEMHGSLTYQPNPDAMLLVQRLTPREQEILRELLDGSTNQSIADELQIRLSTVKKHTGNVYTKLGVNNRAEALSFIMHNNLWSMLDGI